MESMGFKLVLAVAVAMGTAACSPVVQQGSPVDAPAPQVHDLSTYTASVGDPLEFFGNGFIDSEDGWVEITFRGRFTPTDGSPPQEVDLAVPLETPPNGTLRWDRFGAYRIPFGRGDQTGTFEGFVFATNKLFEGGSVEQANETWLPVTFTVLPSLVVMDFRAVGESFIADCKDPAPQALNMVPYAFRVKAVGFEPYSFDYQLSEGLLQGTLATTSVTSFRYVTEVSEIEHSVLTQWAPVPEHTDGFRASVQVSAPGTDGITRKITYPFMVRRPLEVYFRGPMQIAEIFDPEPVSGCIPGGPASVEVNYSETRTETRERATGFETSRGWERDYGSQHQSTWGRDEAMGGDVSMTNAVAMSDARNEGYDVSTTDTFSRTDGRARTSKVEWEQVTEEEWDWRIEMEEVNDLLGSDAESVHTIDEGGAVIIKRGHNLTNQASRGYVDGERVKDVTEHGELERNSNLEGEENTRSTEEQRARAYGSGHHWGVTQSYEEQNSSSQGRNWNQSRSFQQALVQSQTLGERLSEGRSEVLTVSSSQAESLGISAYVWAGQYGVWYRQTTRLIRRASIVAYDLCGNGSEVGEVIQDDWAWAPDLAIGDECPPAPNLPPAECRIPPCSGR